jgi:hypothetical protein
MGAPTDAFLEGLARAAPRQAPARPPTAEFAAHASVRRYADSLGDLTADERNRRLNTLEDFAQFLGRAPDTMVDEVRDREMSYSDTVKRFGAQIDGPDHLQLARSNVVRSFFIANGFRLPAERPSWM